MGSVKYSKHGLGLPTALGISPGCLGGYMIKFCKLHRAEWGLKIYHSPKSNKMKFMVRLLSDPRNGKRQIYR